MGEISNGRDFEWERFRMGEISNGSGRDFEWKRSQMGAIPNGDALLSTTRRYTAITSASPFRVGFTNAGYNHGSRYERVPPPVPRIIGRVSAFVVQILKP